MASTDTDPGTEFPELSEVALLATNSNLPVESMVKATGVTGTDSVSIVGTPLTWTWTWTWALLSG
jgi:hypothetical protein